MRGPMAASSGIAAIATSCDQMTPSEEMAPSRRGMPLAKAPTIGSEEEEDFIRVGAAEVTIRLDLGNMTTDLAVPRYAAMGCMRMIRECATIVRRRSPRTQGRATPMGLAIRRKLRCCQ